MALSVAFTTHDPLQYWYPKEAPSPIDKPAADLAIFIAYGFRLSYLPENEHFDKTDFLSHEEVVWLREYFLQALEQLLFQLWDVGEPGHPLDNFEVHFAELPILTFGQPGSGDVLALQWELGDDDDNEYGVRPIQLHFFAAEGDPTLCKYQKLFLTPGATMDPVRALNLIETARRLNGTEIMHSEPKRALLWDELLELHTQHRED